MTSDQELRVVELCKQFISLSEELHFTFHDLCRIRDKYFPVINGAKILNPADLAKSAQILEDHCTQLRSVLTQAFGANAPDAAQSPAAEPVVATVKPEAAKVTGIPAVVTKSEAPAIPGVPPVSSDAKTSTANAILDKYIDDYEVGARTKGKVRELIAQARSGTALTKKDIEYLQKSIKGKLMAAFLESFKTE